VETVSSALDSSSCQVHLACHAFQDPILGMQSGFALYDGHLNLHHVASKNLANGQFAFLSACQAATGLETLPGDISKTTTFLSELVQTCTSLHKPKKSASHKLNQLGQNFDKFML